MGSRGQVVKAMVVIRRPSDGALLVSESFDDELFHRPLGGHVEYGELAADTARRELDEELGQPLADVRQVGVIENLFESDGALVHEIVFVLAASFADPAAYEIEEQTVRDSPGGTRVIWRAPGTTSPPLYPAGVAELADLAAQGTIRRDVA